MAKKVYPNDPCPCGSGKKYKKCCFNKKDDDRYNDISNLRGIYKELRKEARIKQCLHPNKEECSEKIIGAHSIQNNKILKKISSNGSILMPCPKPDGDIISLTKYGRKEASVFSGFCGYHDKMIFQKIEDCDFEKSVDQVFLYTYRAFALEYHRHQEGARMGEIMFSKKPSLVNMEDEDNPFLGPQMAVKDLKIEGEEFNNALLSGNYDILTSIVWEFAGEVKFAATGTEAPQFDLSNNKIQDLTDLKTPAKHMYVSVFPENGKTYCIISWLKSNDKLFASIGKELNSLNVELRKNYINNLLPIITENIAINPEAWDRMSSQQKEGFMSRFWGIDSFFQITGEPLDRLSKPEYDLFEI